VCSSSTARVSTRYPTTGPTGPAWPITFLSFFHATTIAAAAVRNETKLEPNHHLWTLGRKTMGASLDAILADLKSPFVSYSHTSLNETRVANNRLSFFCFCLVGRNISAREALFKSSPMYVIMFIFYFYKSALAHSKFQHLALGPFVK
jgi:hypothetical protein